MVPNIPDNVKEVSEQQTAISWGRITRGKLSKKWADIVQEYLHNHQLKSSTTNSTRWFTNLTVIIWQGLGPTE